MGDKACIDCREAVTGSREFRRTQTWSPEKGPAHSPYLLANVDCDRCEDVPGNWYKVVCRAAAEDAVAAAEKCVTESLGDWCIQVPEDPACKGKGCTTMCVPETEVVGAIDESHRRLTDEAQDDFERAGFGRWMYRFVQLMDKVPLEQLGQPDK